MLTKPGRAVFVLGMSYKFHLVVRNIGNASPFVARQCKGRAIFMAGPASVVGKGTDETSFGYWSKASAASKKGREAARNARVYAEYCNELARPTKTN